jgi:hypothetical protein
MEESKNAGEIFYFYASEKASKMQMNIVETYLIKYSRALISLPSPHHRTNTYVKSADYIYLLSLESPCRLLRLRCPTDAKSSKYSPSCWSNSWLSLPLTEGAERMRVVPPTTVPCISWLVASMRSGGSLRAASCLSKDSREVGSLSPSSLETSFLL